MHVLQSVVNRRTLLRHALAGGVVLAAGCVGDEPAPGEGQSDSPSGTESDDPDRDDSTPAGTDAPDPTGTGEPTGTDGSSPTDGSTGTGEDGATSSPSPADGDPRLAGRSFEVVSNDCGQGRNEADATAEGRTVTVTGTIDGSNTCYTARLKGVSLDGSGTTLRVDVESYVPESDGTRACGQCIVDIEYESTFEFEDGRPDEVVVRHDGEQVATVSLQG